MKSSPNKGHLQTGLEEINEKLSEPGQLQTGFRGNHEKLSEHGPTSDRFLG
ncbi:hypothetical protein [Bacillus sp. ISL-55]|uniref:hypothetical protein n=1 Tax=Bacillus sp. ISL-55 TaxID=2819134 RepID=UPI001BECF647|nr:hypothetical protein [Bacillus sp. ISL-55]MBT2694916.1 hypothetical protein [Bacillus sp. ISL-55]